MSKKKLLAIMLCVICAVLINFYVFHTVKPDTDQGVCQLMIAMEADQNLDVQVFYAEQEDFSENQSNLYSYMESEGKKEIVATIPVNTDFLRIDFGEEAAGVTIDGIYLDIRNYQQKLEMDRIAAPLIANCISMVRQTEDSVIFQTEAEDPYIVLSIADMQLEKIYQEAYAEKYLIYDLLLCLFVDLIALLCIINIKALTRVPLDIYHERVMFWDLAKNDFQARFAGSYLGIFWAFIQPVITMLLYWFVFQVGLRSGNVSDHPFVLFLMSGLIPWFYFSEAFSGATNSLAEYSYLVKKVVFEVGILPALKVASSIFVHLFFVAFIIVMCAIYGYVPDAYLLQILYYIICMAFLVLGLSYITSACTAFFKDMTQIVNIALTIGVWLTPIMWNVQVLSPKLQLIFRLNPMYYIVDGFRDSLLSKVWFWEKPVWTIYFWGFSILVYIFGIKLFNRLKVHFSDVL
jgi:teichoic acid transport system permease protein